MDAKLSDESQHEILIVKNETCAGDNSRLSVHRTTGWQLSTSSDKTRPYRRAPLLVSIMAIVLITTLESNDTGCCTAVKSEDRLDSH